MSSAGTQRSTQGAGRKKPDYSAGRLVRSEDLIQRKKARLERGDLPVDLEIRYQEELYEAGFGLMIDID